MHHFSHNLKRLLNPLIALALFLTAASGKAWAQNANVDMVDKSAQIDPTRLNLFPEQFNGKTIYYTCILFGGFEKDGDIFGMRLTRNGTFFNPILKSRGITFITSSNIASQVISMPVRNKEDCDLTLGFRVEQFKGYWIAKVFEVAVYDSIFSIGDVVSDDPDTSVIAAGKRGDAYSVEALLKRYKNANAADIHGKTALMYSAEKGHTKTVKTLLKYGANPSIQSKESKTALAYARQAGKKDLVKILENAGARE